MKLVAQMIAQLDFRKFFKKISLILSERIPELLSRDNIIRSLKIKISVDRIISIICNT